MATLVLKIISDGAGATKAVDGLSQGMNRAKDSAANLRKETGLLSKAVGHVSTEVRDLAKGLVAGFGAAAAVRTLSAASEMAREFGREVAKVSTALTDTSQMDRYVATLRSMSREYGLSASAQAASLYEIISAGQQAEQAILTLDAANRLAIGGLTSVETAADGLTSVMNAYAGKIRSAKQASDVMFAGAAAGKTNIEQLSSTLGQVAPIAAAVGVSFDELVGSVAALTLGGVSTNVAVTQMRSVLSSLVKPSSEAQKLAEDLGLEFTTAALRAKGLAGFLEDVREKTGGSERAIATLFGQVEATGAVLALTGNQAASFAKTLDATANSAGATEAAYTKMADTADQAFKKAQAAAQSLLIDLGTQLNTILVPAAKAFSENVDGIAAALTIAAKVGGAYIVLFVALPAIYNAATVASWNFVASLTAQNVGFMASIQSMGLLRAAGGLLLAAFTGWTIGTELRDQFVEVRLFGIAMVEGLMVAWERMKMGAAIAWEAIKYAAIGAFNAIKERIADMVMGLAGAVESIDFLGVYEGAIAGAREFAAGMLPAQYAMDAFAESATKIKNETDANIAKIRETTGAMADYEIEAEAAKKASEGLAKGTQDTGNAAEDAAKGLDKVGKEAKDATPTLNALNTLLRAQARTLGNDYADAALDYADATDQIAKTEAELIELGALGVEQQNQLTEARENALKILQKTTEELDQAAQDEAARKLAEDAEELNMILDRTANMGFGGLIHELELVGKALQDAMDRGEDVSRLKAAMGGLKQELAVNMVGATQQVLGSIQSMTKEGSKAYKAMEVASHALNVVLAISAILNQGKGDPYTSFARMAAMAVAVAGLVGSLGGFGGGGGGSNSAEYRQEMQGTGTVLGDASAKSESIANATQITADATSELVGINRGMLRALQTMQNGIGNVAANLAQTGFEEISLASGRFSSSFLGPITPILGGLLNSIFGGDQDLLDQGLLINGGRFGQVSQNPNASTYQTIETDGGWFHSDDIDERLSALSQSARNQIKLVLQSLGDAVREGARALGLDMEQVNAAIEAYRIAEIRISTMDMTGEETQAALEAAFSAIFDGLAGAVVPFIGQFQRVGEGLGETLVRVATGVQVTQEALMRLGFALDVTDPEQFAQLSEGLIEAAGGLEEFIDGMSSFMDAFAPEAHKFEILQNDLSRALEEVGLTIPETRDGMWELMQSLDATTEEGRKQIAALLRLSDVADAYYTQLERNAEEAAEAVEDFSLATAEFTQGLADAVFNQEASEFQKAMMSIRRTTASSIADANAIARARGEEGASARDLALIHRWVANEVKKAIAQLENAARALADELGYGELDTILAQIAEIEAATSNSYGSQVDGINSVGEAGRNMFDEWETAAQSLRDYLDSLLVGELSPLSPEEQMAEARRQLDEAMAAAAGGDINALNALPQLADQWLRMLQGSEASGMDYSGPAQQLIDQLRALGVNPYSPISTNPNQGPVQLVPSPELEALYQRRDELLAQQTANERLLMAQELAGYVVELAEATGRTVFAVMEDLGINLASFITDLGATVTADTAEAVVALGEVANTLGVELPELADAIGASLGELNDTQSLINDAFELQLSTLPEEFRTQLEPAFRALEDASSPEETNVALDELNRLTEDLPEEFRLRLAPYLSQVDPITPDLANELDYLSDISGTTAAANALLEQIRQQLVIANGGTIPDPPPEAASAVALVDGGSKVGDAQTSAIIVELQMLREAVRKAGDDQKAAVEQGARSSADAALTGADRVRESVDNLRATGGSLSYYQAR